MPKPVPVGSLKLPWDEQYKTVFTGSGTEALSLAVEAAITTKADVAAPEVIIPAYGCPDIVAAIVAQNARPVLVDFVDGKPVMDEQSIADAITSQTVAIIGVGFLGAHERLEMLSRLCSSNGLTLIEDSAQCFPPVGSGRELADFAVLSFGRGKPINLMGGGALLIRRATASIEDSIQAKYPLSTVRLNAMWHIKRRIFNVLLSRYLYPILAYLPFLRVGQTRYKPLSSINLLDIPGALLGGGVTAYNERKLLHLTYNHELAFLVQAGWRQINTGGAEGCTPMLRYALLAPTREIRDSAVKALNKRGIGANAFYEYTLPAFFDQAVSVIGSAERHSYPVAEDFAARLITLPTHDGVMESDVRTIISVFEYFKVT